MIKTSKTTLQTPLLPPHLKSQPIKLDFVQSKPKSKANPPFRDKNLVLDFSYRELRKIYSFYLEIKLFYIIIIDWKILFRFIMRDCRN